MAWGTCFEGNAEGEERRRRKKAKKEERGKWSSTFGFWCRRGAFLFPRRPPSLQPSPLLVFGSMRLPAPPEWCRPMSNCAGQPTARSRCFAVFALEGALRTVVLALEGALRTVVLALGEALRTAVLAVEGALRTVVLLQAAESKGLPCHFGEGFGKVLQGGECHLGKVPQGGECLGKVLQEEELNCYYNHFGFDIGGDLLPCSSKRQCCQQCWHLVDGCRRIPARSLHPRFRADPHSCQSAEEAPRGVQLQREPQARGKVVLEGGLVAEQLIPEECRRLPLYV